MRSVLFVIWMLLVLQVHAEGDSLRVEPQGRGGNLWERFYEVVKKFSQIDTNYIEPQHYNYTVMMQGTYSYERYTISGKSGEELVLSPDPTVKVGPYFGWRWIFLGYTLDISHMGDGKKRQDFNVSFYSNQIGVDLFYRKTGVEYKIKSLNMGGDIGDSHIHNVPFDGFHSSIKGFNLYYIFNHRKFSYPAAFSQSTCQKRSCGSLLAGIGYTNHTLKLDMEKLHDVVKERVGEEVAEAMGEDLESMHVEYTDVSASVGYAYNWVFARNCLFAASLSAALGYKRTKGEANDDHLSLSNFSFSNFNLDGIGRFGVVWNNTRWYAGANAVFHSYNYERSQFSTNSMFGNVNVYFGFNFGRR